MKRNNKGSAGREAGRLFLNPQAVIYGLILAFLWTGLIAFFLGFCGFYIRVLGERADTLVLVAGLGGDCLGAGSAGGGRIRLAPRAWLALLYSPSYSLASFGRGERAGSGPLLSWGTALGLLRDAVLIPAVGSRLSVIETVNSQEGKHCHLPT